jgi:hypothetical protein
MKPMVLIFECDVVDLRAVYQAFIAARGYEVEAAHRKVGVINSSRENRRAADHSDSRLLNSLDVFGGTRGAESRTVCKE